MKLSEKQQEFTFDISLLIQYAYGLGVKLTMGEAFRTPSQVLLNYYGGKVVKTKLGLELATAPKVSKTLNSKHSERLAIDFNFFIDGELIHDHPFIDHLGEYWKRLRPDVNRWGGDFKSLNDPYHFERI